MRRNDRTTDLQSVSNKFTGRSVLTPWHKKSQYSCNFPLQEWSSEGTIGNACFWAKLENLQSNVCPVKNVSLFTSTNHLLSFLMLYCMVLWCHLFLFAYLFWDSFYKQVIIILGNLLKSNHLPLLTCVHLSGLYEHFDWRQIKRCITVFCFKCRWILKFPVQ